VQDARDHRVRPERAGLISATLSGSTAQTQKDGVLVEECSPIDLTISQLDFQAFRR
jgi:hypothetical protein